MMNPATPTALDRAIAWVDPERAVRGLAYGNRYAMMADGGYVARRRSCSLALVAGCDIA